MGQEQRLLSDQYHRWAGRSYPCDVATGTGGVGLLSPTGLADRCIETTGRAAPVAALW
jgi:hypothetical protein